MTKSWEDDLCYTSPKGHEHTVNGKTQKFYPVSVGLIFKLRTTGRSVAKAFGAIFADNKKDVQITDNTVSANGGIDRTIQTLAVDLGIAKYRDDQRTNALGEVIDAFTSEETLLLLAEIIIDSLADVFPKDSNGVPQGPTPAQFIAKTKLPTMAQMIIGVAKGNQDVFGPLAEKVSSFLTDLEKVVTAKVAKLAEEKVATEKTPESAS